MTDIQDSYQRAIQYTGFFDNCYDEMIRIMPVETVIGFIDKVMELATVRSQELWVFNNSDLIHVIAELHNENIEESNFSINLFKLSELSLLEFKIHNPLLQNNGNGVLFRDKTVTMSSADGRHLSIHVDKTYNQDRVATFAFINQLIDVTRGV